MAKVVQKENIDKGAALLIKLTDLFKLSRRFKDASSVRSIEIKDEINDINLQLSDLETNLIHARIDGNETTKASTEAKEAELLTRLTLLRQKQNSMQGEGNYVISQKLTNIIPEIVEAEKEYKIYEQEMIKRSEVIKKQINDLRTELGKINRSDHPYYHCNYLIDDLEKAGKLEKGTVNQAIRYSKGLDKMVNPYFGDI